MNYLGSYRSYQLLIFHWHQTLTVLHTFNGPLCGTIQVSRNQKGKTRWSLFVLQLPVICPCSTQPQNAGTSLVTSPAKGSGLRQPFWSSSASMDWLQNICLSTASWRPAVHICDQPTRACCLFCTHGQPTVTGVLLSVDQVTWNSLPVALRSSDVMEETFRRHLKTFLFNCLDN